MKIIAIINIISFVLFIIISILLFDYNIPSITNIEYKLDGDRPDQQIDIIYYIIVYTWLLSTVILTIYYKRNKNG